MIRKIWLKKQGIQLKSTVFEIRASDSLSISQNSEMVFKKRHQIFLLQAFAYVCGIVTLTLQNGMDGEAILIIGIEERFIRRVIAAEESHSLLGRLETIPVTKSK